MEDKWLNSAESNINEYRKAKQNKIKASSKNISKAKQPKKSVEQNEMWIVEPILHDLITHCKTVDHYHIW